MAMASSWKTSHREHQTALAALAFALTAAIASLVVMAIFLFPASPTGTVAPVYVGRIESIPLREPVYYREGGFWLVRLTEDDVVAFSARDPGPSAYCWMSEYNKLNTRSPRTLTWERRQNGNFAFSAICTASFYSVDGSVLSGPAYRQLDRFPVAVDDGFVTVHPGMPNLLRGRLRK